ncbi:metal-sensitive transcriptional regulator [Candidatus Gracilibacteria bacterium]|nr:metal-sensitive transcriptional regulator [Candidatus Gracilibacteria bacterium]
MENIVNRLQRIEGQVRALQTMVQDESDCEKIVTQFKAAQSALDSCFTQLMTDNLQQCITSQDTRKLKSILKILLKQGKHYHFSLFSFHFFSLDVHLRRLLL